MNWLVVGAWQVPWHQEAISAALERAGVTVHRVPWWPFFWVRQGIGAPFKSVLHRVQYRIAAGPAVSALQDRIVSEARRVRPDVLLLYPPTLVLHATLKTLRAAHPEAIIASYNNDDPFSRRADPLLWRHFRRTLPAYDCNLVYREVNVDEARDAGGRFPRLLRSYYLPDEDIRVTLEAPDHQYACDAVFVGHYEDDGRLECLEALARAGIKVNLFGGGWAIAYGRIRRGPLAHLMPIRDVLGDEYRKAICGAKIALSFLSKVNRDTYTRRSFEIPAMEAFQLSEYSDDLARLFQEDREIVMFRDPDDLVRKAQHYLQADAERIRIAQAGRGRVVRDGHDVDSRARECISVIGEARLAHASSPLELIECQPGQ